MQELLKLQAEMTKKNTTSLDINTHAANDLKMDVKKLSEINVKAANDAEYKKKREEEVSDSLKKLNVTIRDAIKNGLGAATAAKIKGNEDAKQNATMDGKFTLRKALLGTDKGDSVKSTFGISTAIDKWLTKREVKAATAKEKKEFVANAITNDPGAIGVANFKGGTKTAEGKAAAEKYAGEKFEKIKAKEAEVTAAQAKIDASENAGYAAKKKDIKSRDEKTAELAVLDPRMKSTLKREGENAPHTQVEEEKAEGAKFQADEVKAQGDQVIVEQGIGKTLIDSLGVQKEQLAALTQLIALGGTGGGGSGSSILGDVAEGVMDSMGGKGGKGKMLGKAGKFLSRAGPGLLKGGLLSAGGELVEMGGDALTEAGHEKVGGAVSTLGTAGKYAGYGAMIGSVVPGLGTAVGAGVGGVIGAGVGLYNNWGNMFGGKKENMEIAGAGETQYDEMGNPIGTSSSALNTASKTNEELKTKGKSSGTTVVNAPTTINNNGGKDKSVDIRAPLRNQESSVNGYIANRYA